jgi:hypothetical protein
MGELDRKKGDFQWGENSVSSAAIILSMSQKTKATEVILLYSYTPLEKFALASDNFPHTR